MTRPGTPLLLALCLLAGCGSSDHAPAGQAGAGGSGGAADGPMPWVDPARCVSPCTHPDESHLVAVDAQGRLDPAGRERVARQAQPDLEAMLAAARAEGRGVAVDNGFRTYATQSDLYAKGHESEPGRAARPGHSEHELGLAIDLALADEPSTAWVAAHAFEHGFVLSFPRGKEKQTGYRFEPWHVRHVGHGVAAELHASGLTLQEWFQADPSRGTWGGCEECTDPASRSDCSAVTAEGACAGTVLAFCMEGAEARVDCAASGLSCSVGTGGASCGAP